MEREITNRIERSDLFAVLVADTAIAENYRNPAKCLSWLTASHRAWLIANAEFNAMASRPVFYRYILLPYPSLISSPPRRAALRDTILLHLHLHLWHGVITGIVFFDPRQKEIASVLADLNFIALPSQRTILDTPAFYSGENLNTAVYTGAAADRRYNEVRRLLFPSGRHRPIWLHYDEWHFSTTRLTGWRWEALRLFFGRLYGNDLFCFFCHQPLAKFDLDHIAPVSKGYYQTLINLRPLCASCNKKKADLIVENPFQLKLLLAEDLLTQELQDLHRLPPPWIGRLPSPASPQEIDSKLEHQD